MARGSIRPRPSKDGKRTNYRVKWETRGPNGERVYHSETLPTKKEAEAFLAKQLADIDQGTFVVPTKETVAAFLERWLSASTPSLSEATVHKYRSIIRNHITPHIGSRPLVRIDELTLQELYATLLTSGSSQHSVAAVHTLLHGAFARAVAWRLIPRNPADGVTAPSSQPHPPAVWTADEAEDFLIKTKDHRFAPLWRLALDSGMRAGEILALAWRDLDLERGVVAVRRTLTRNTAGGWKIGEVPKTSTSHRSIVLGARTVAELRTHKARQAERRLACGGAWVDLGLVVDRGDGHWINPGVHSHAFGRAVALAQLPPLTPHGLRHTMATLLLAAGVHPKIVQERLGHKSIQMTLDLYSHVSMTMQKDAAALIDQLLGDRTRPERGHQTG